MKALTLLLLSLALASCGSSEDPAVAGGTSPELPTDFPGGRQYFATTCVPCHGEKGKGDGAASAALEPKPRDLTDKDWQASVDDEYLRKIIQYGGQMVGKALTMPPNPVLGSQPEVLNGVVAHVRNLGK